MVEALLSAVSKANPGLWRSLELAHRSLVSGGLPVGAVLLAADGAVLAEGRNRAYDPPGGDDRLQGSPIAHAELNVLSAVDTGADLTPTTLWSSHRPCEMCSAACSFVGVGTVRWVAADPSDDDHSDPDDVDHRWASVAILLFLSGILGYSGPGAPMLSRARKFEPEVMQMIDSLDPSLLLGPTLAASLTPLWPEINHVAETRSLR